jgi:hypothetical protein
MTQQLMVLYLLMTACLAFSACAKRWPAIDLTPANKRHVYSTVVGDADEAGLLVQQLKIEPARLEFGRLLFYASTEQLNAMRALGYDFQQSAASEVNYRVVEVRRTARQTEQDLTRAGVLILNRETDFWVIRGSLGHLSALQRAGFQLRNLTDEPRPREVRIVVPRVEDIQRVSDTGVDILGVDPRPREYSSEQQVAPQRFTIGATAFDYQIDKLKEAGFEITVRPYPPRQQKRQQP